MKNSIIKKITSVFLTLAILMSNTGSLYLAESQEVEPDGGVVQAQYIIGESQEEPDYGSESSWGQEPDDSGNVQAQFIIGDHNNAQNGWDYQGISQEQTNTIETENNEKTVEALVVYNGDDTITVKHKNGSMFNASWNLQTSNIWQILGGMSEDEIGEYLENVRYDALKTYMESKRVSTGAVTQEDADAFVKMVDMEFMTIADSNGYETDESGLFISLYKSPSKELRDFKDNGFEIVVFEYKNNEMNILSKEDAFTSYTTDDGLMAEFKTDSEKFCIAVIDGKSALMDKETEEETEPPKEEPVDEEFMQEYLKELEEDGVSFETELPNDAVVDDYLKELEEEENILETEDIQNETEVVEEETDRYMEEIKTEASFEAEETEISEKEPEISETTENLETEEEIPEETEDLEIEEETEYSAGTAAQNIHEESIETEAEETEEASEEAEETEEETEALSEIETEAASEAETEIETDAETEIETDSESEIENESETEMETDSEIETEIESETEMETESESVETEIETEEETEEEFSGNLIAQTAAGNLTVSAYSENENAEGSLETRAATEEEVSGILTAYMAEQNIADDIEHYGDIIQYANIFSLSTEEELNAVSFTADAFDTEEALKVINGNYAWRIACVNNDGWQLVKADSMNPEAKEDGSMKMSFHVPSNEFAIVKMDLTNVGMAANNENEEEVDENPLIAKGLKVFVYDDDHSDTTLTVPEDGIETGSTITAVVKPEEGYRITYVYIAEVKGV